MRIALAASSYAPHIGGVEEHVRNVARLLSARGNDVVVWTIDRDGKFKVRTVDGVEVWYLPAPLPARSLTDVMRFMSRVPAAAHHWGRAFRQFRPDVIHVQCFGPNGTYARRLARRTHTPLIVSSHGETIADDAGVFDYSRLARSNLTSSLEQAHAVTGCSNVVLDDLRSRFGLDSSRGIVVPNGIEIDEQEETSSLPLTSGRYIAAIGRLQEVKGFDLLINAFARARLENGMRLVIGGDGTESGRLRQLVSRLGLEDSVVLPGRLDRASVAALMAHAAVVVIPSRFEAFGITVLEAWRAGAAVVATRRGGPPEFVTDGVDGVLCDPTDIDSLATAIAGLATDPSRAMRIAAAGRKRVGDFTWDHTVDEYERIYESISRTP